ncbi:MAG: hypothetical protein HY287_08575 [Planctomycetes bacterium]|nr:hypothetical protein [Planctomycetota bacterium]
MSLYIDDVELNDDDLAAGSLEEALRVVQARICAPGHVVVAVHCDGATVPPNAMTDTLKRPVFSFERLDVYTGTKESLVIDAMSQAAASLEATESKAQDIAHRLTAGSSAEAIAVLADSLRVWQQIHQAIGQSIVMLGLNPETIQIRDVPLADALDRPRSVLVQIKQALQSQDYVLLADLLQYEFSDVTDLWHQIVTRLEHEARSRLM